MLKRLFILGAVISLTAGATFAYFSATASSSDNTVEAGTLKFGSPVSNDFSVTNAAPGETYAGDHNPYDVGNKGSIDAEHIEIDVATTVTDQGGDASPDMDEMLLVSKMRYGDVDGSYVDLQNIITTHKTDTSWTNGTYGVRLEGGNTFASLLNSDDQITLARWKNYTIEVYDDTGTGGAPEGLKANSTAGKADFELELTFDSDAGNKYQEDSVDATLTFTLNQDANQ